MCTGKNKAIYEQIALFLYMENESGTTGKEEENGRKTEKETGLQCKTTIGCVSGRTDGSISGNRFSSDDGSRTGYYTIKTS